ncbi:hypothetical protein [Kribbella endophytica]
MPHLDFPFTLDRRVQLWSYEISHSVLLLRANQTADLNTRVDFMFRVVHLIRLPHAFENLTISLLPDAKSIDAPELSDGVPDGYQLYGLTSAGAPARSFVLAGSFHVCEDTRDFGDPTSLGDRAAEADARWNATHHAPAVRTGPDSDGH